VTAEHAAGVGGEVEATIEHYRWLRANLPLDNLGHITSCTAVEGDNCRCATFAQRVATRDASTRQAAADAVLAEAHRLASAHHVASNEHGRIVALGERLAAAARGAK
jgi:hypothetical protein